TDRLTSPPTWAADCWSRPTRIAGTNSGARCLRFSGTSPFRERSERSVRLRHRGAVLVLLADAEQLAVFGDQDAADGDEAEDEIASCNRDERTIKEAAGDHAEDCAADRLDEDKDR